MVGTNLRVETEAGVLHVTINRAEKRNALSRAVLAELRELFQARADDAAVLVAVLRGAGDRCFAAGGDLRDLSAVRRSDEATAMAEEGKAALEAVRRFPVPVVAALNGDALGGGAELALACDFRVLATHAAIGFIHGRLNIATAWGGGVDLLRLLGPALGLRLLARSELVDAETALSLGLADTVAHSGEALDDAVQRFLEPLRRQVPQVTRAYKALALAARGGQSRETMLALETRLFSDTWIHPDHWTAAEKLLARGGKS
jgi:enoyl-CoA hydratase